MVYKKSFANFGKILLLDLGNNLLDIMNFYIFKPATNTAETGSQYPQVQKMNPEYDYKAPNSVHQLSRANSDFPDFKPNLDYFIVHSQAKLTDLLSVTPLHGGLLISDKLKNIFDQFNIAPHRYYPAKIKHRKNFYDNYYWMHIICDLSNIVDYQKSSFFIYYNYGHNLGHINVSSKEEYFILKEKVKTDNPGKTVTIWADKIHLTSGFNKNIDLFEIGSFNADYFISTSLKEKILQEKISGCNISLASNLFT